jgi:hypothetical protein
MSKDAVMGRETRRAFDNGSVGKQQAGMPSGERPNTARRTISSVIACMRGRSG